MQLHVEKAKDIGGVGVFLGLGDMTEAKADAYIVPQFQEGASEGGVAAAICRAGAQVVVIDGYELIVQKAGGSVEFGQAFITPSYGGNTPNLIHVVSVGSGIEREYGTVYKAIYNALTAANKADIKSIIAPVLGTGIIGALTNEQSAKAMFSAIRQFAINNPGSGIQITFVAYGNPADKNHPTFQALRDVLAHETYIGATAVVGQRDIDLQRFVEEINCDATLGTTPLEGKVGPDAPKAVGHRFQIIGTGTHLTEPK